MYANTGAGTYEKAVDMATRDFLKAGINCIEYANGSRHTVKDYARMAIQTASKRAYLTGEGLSAKLLGKNPDGDRQYYVEKFIESLSAHTDAADIKNGDESSVVPSVEFSVFPSPVSVPEFSSLPLPGVTVFSASLALSVFCSAVSSA